MENIAYKNYFDKYLKNWNIINGYDIEQVISNLGYKFDGYSQFGCLTMHHVNDNGNFAYLSLPGNEDRWVPTFREFAEKGKQISSISFRKYVSVGVLIDSNSEDFVQVAPYGRDNFEMSYYSSGTILEMFSYQNGKLDNEPLPDEIRHIDTVDPNERINLAYEWANAIRNNKGLDKYPSLKKVK